MDKMWPANVIKIIVFCTKLQKKIINITFKLRVNLSAILMVILVFR